MSALVQSETIINNTLFKSFEIDNCLCVLRLEQHSRRGGGGRLSIAQEFRDLSQRQLQILLRQELGVVQEIQVSMKYCMYY